MAVWRNFTPDNIEGTDSTKCMTDFDATTSICVLLKVSLFSCDIRGYLFLITAETLRNSSSSNDLDPETKVTMDSDPLSLVFDMYLCSVY